MVRGDSMWKRRRVGLRASGPECFVIASHVVRMMPGMGVEYAGLEDAHSSERMQDATRPTYLHVPKVTVLNIICVSVHLSAATPRSFNFQTAYIPPLTHHTDH